MNAFTARSVSERKTPVSRNLLSRWNRDAGTYKRQDRQVVPITRKSSAHEGSFGGAFPGGGGLGETMKTIDFSKETVLTHNAHAFTVFSLSPVAEGHTLVFPRREVASLFLLPPEEYAACWELAQRTVCAMRLESPAPDGFTVGVNDGEAAGQTVSRAHIHVIPRRVGDNPNPRGGIRAVIPGKADPRA